MRALRWAAVAAAATDTPTATVVLAPLGQGAPPQRAFARRFHDWCTLIAHIPATHVRWEVWHPDYNGTPVVRQRTTVGLIIALIANTPGRMTLTGALGESLAASILQAVAGAESASTRVRVEADQLACRHPASGPVQLRPDAPCRGGRRPHILPGT